MAGAEKSMILRCSHSDDAPWLSKEKSALICDKGQPITGGYGAYLVSEEVLAHNPDNPLLFAMPEHCLPGDFVRVERDKVPAQLIRLFTADRSERTLFLTGQCNSNCVMCPYSTRQRSASKPSGLDELLQYIELMDPAAEYICITGGEPTLLKDGFITLLSAVKAHLPNALVHILTNGRTFCYRDFFDAYQSVRPFQTLLGIPLHASNESLHDMIAGASGSFRQTIKGLDHCYANGEHIELRIVTSALNADNLAALALFVGTRYPAANHVSLMGLEMMGNAMINRSAVWIGFESLMPKIERAVDILLAYGVSVRLFNYPLCYVSPKYQSLYYRSISDYKIRYKPECEKCAKKTNCGGFFQTTIVMPGISVKPFSEG